jgi:cysteinyl-tRNA synthetase
MPERLRAGSGEDSAEQQRGGSGESSPGSRIEAFRAALADDFNTPRAMAEVFELVGEANRGDLSVAAAVPVLVEMLGLVGLGTLAEPDEGAEADEGALHLMAEREQARVDKDFQRADEIRDRLAEMGWTVRDSADGPSLVPKS